MKQSKMQKNLLQSIRKSIGRYIAIAVIIALGNSMFIGLKSTRRDMVETGQIYMDEQNMFDLRLLTSYGWGKEQLADIAQLEGVEEAEGVYYTDLIACGGDSQEAVYRFYTMPTNINRLVLRSGRMPERPEECLADGYSNSHSVIGQKITLTMSNSEDALETVTQREFVIVGTVSTPLYMDMNRGSTSVGNGSISNYFFVQEEVFDVDYYTEIYVTLPGEHRVYTQAYNDAMDAAAEKLKLQLEPMAEQRLQEVRADAVEAYSEGMESLSEGLTEYHDGKEKAEQELHDGFQELIDSYDTLRKSEESLIAGEQQIKDAKVTIAQSRKTLASSRQTLASSKAEAYKKMSDANDELFQNYQMVTSNMQKVNDGIMMATLGMIDVNSKIIQKENELTQVKLAIESLLAGQGTESPGGGESTEGEEQPPQNTEELQELYKKQATLEAELAELYIQRTEITAGLTELGSQKQQLQTALDTIEAGRAELTSQQLAMEQQFNAAEAQIVAGEAQLNAYESELEIQTQTIADGWVALEQGKKDYLTGSRTYFDARKDALAELKDAETEIEDARQQLIDARKTIADMTKNDPIVLDRSSNLGYGSLDSSSQIVEGISKVFPVFFLLVAALVCITTMTRMVDEERTQIGTLKALGYSNAAIISKYLLYAGSSAVLGCILGCAIGSTLFPQILWEAYKILIYITPKIAIRVDWVLCIGISLVYLALMLAVTWHCCRRELAEVPAELIRPKPPAVGKQLFIEKMKLWKRLSFLNKITIRNIFQYRQRLAMMLLGVGGCTALLLTGFGFRDSIMDVVDIQFEEVSVYDLALYFGEGQTEEQQAALREEMAPYAEKAVFFHQSSVELEASNQTKNVYLLAAGPEIRDMIDLHLDGRSVPMPGPQQVLISTGAASAMGIKPGDTVVLRDSDMRPMELTVSGIFANHVQNYAIVLPETVASHWGGDQPVQTAYVVLQEGVDAYAAGAEAGELDGVMNVSISQELASSVGSMLEALDLIVVVIVICAGLLAAIVLYNLTNINITERIREIATIKVLGFNSLETAMYVFKENLVLSVLGGAVGLPMGKLLLNFVISQVKIDMMWIDARALPMSFVYSIAMTILMAVVVNCIFYFRLEKINMAEALKSVE